MSLGYVPNIFRNQVGPIPLRELDDDLSFVSGKNPSVLDGFNVAADGVADDTAGIIAAVAAYAGRTIYFPAGTYRITAPIAIPANTTIYGDGPLSIIKTTTVDIHLFTVSAAGVKIRSLKFVGTTGTDATNNSGVVFRSGASNGLVEDCDFTGMTGWPIWMTDCNTITARNNYITLLGTPLADSAHIALYTDAVQCIVDGNYCIDGGTGTWQGIINQVGAKQNKIINNVITGFAAYGIVDYQPTPQQTDNIIAGNTIRDIDGALLSGNSGAGIYLNDCGGDVVANNNIYNTNISTSSESLAPGAIGQAGGFSENIIIGNYIDSPNWYGVMVAGGTSPVNIIGNTVKESQKGGVYIKQSSHVTVAANQITQVTTTPQTVPAITVNTLGGAVATNVNINGNTIHGAGFVAIYLRKVQRGSCSNNTLEAAKGVGMKIQDSDYITCSNNVLEVTVATVQYALQIADATYCRITGNVLKSAYANGAYETSGTCTGTYFDKSNVIVGSDFAAVDNAGTGSKVEMVSDNISSFNAQAGDTIYYTNPGGGAFIGRLCTVSGAPGTWTTWGATT